MLNQPKGLIPAALSNMGERFGFYVMMAILTLFLMSKFDLDSTEAGALYSIFYCSIYILALVGGAIADKTKNYKGTIIAGLIVMSLGYALLAVPAFITTKYIALGALLVIAFGNGLFKGNLQAVVGQLYDNPKYAHKRDSGFQIFYMFINIGGCIAPFIAVWVRNTFVQMQGYAYHAELPGLCNRVLDGKVFDADIFLEYANEVSQTEVNLENLKEFAQSYLNAFNTGFHYAFSVAILAMLISLAIFLIYKKSLPTPGQKKAGAKADPAEIRQSAKEIKQRILALMAVFGIVIFFWFSFHQNGLTLTMFAKDYTQLSIGGKSVNKPEDKPESKQDDTVYGEIMQDNQITHLISKKVSDLSESDIPQIVNAEERKSLEKTISEKGFRSLASDSASVKQEKGDKLERVYLLANPEIQEKRHADLTAKSYKQHEEEVEEPNNGGIKLSAEVFQSINPFVVVFLTPLIMLFFSALAKRGKEPSTPAKIAIGMGIAAAAYVVMTIASLNLPSQPSLDGNPVPEADKVTPMVLFAVYFILTVAELFISPLGLSFVSKVAPAHLQGLMQGCWLGATAVGNACLFLGAMMYQNISLSATWGVFAIVCFISMGIMLAMVKWLERVTA